MRALLPIERRTCAWLLALAMLAGAYFVLLHGWFVAPQWRIAQAMHDLRVERQHDMDLIGQRSAMQQRLVALAGAQSDSAAFLPETDANAAIAGIMQRVVDVAARDTSGACEVTQKLAMPVTASADPYRTVSASVVLDCRSEAALATLLYRLEKGVPYLHADAFSVYRNPTPSGDGTDSPLEVRLTLSGYLRQGTTP
jgi:general secretion pathway protein M